MLGLRMTRLRSSFPIGSSLDVAVAGMSQGNALVGFAVPQNHAEAG